MIDKEDILLRNYSILVKNPSGNGDSLAATITQMCLVNPPLAIRCWGEALQNNYDEIVSGIDYENGYYNRGTLGESLVENLEQNLVGEEFFRHSAVEFAKNKSLIEILYTVSPIPDWASVRYVLAHLIRNHKLQEADSILSAIYKNKTFTSYANLWKEIVQRFEYSDLDNYSSGGFVSDESYRQPEDIQEFCLGWIERIPNEEEQAGASSHIMRIF